MPRQEDGSGRLPSGRTTPKFRQAASRHVVEVTSRRRLRIRTFASARHTCSAHGRKLTGERQAWRDRRRETSRDERTRHWACVHPFPRALSREGRADSVGGTASAGHLLPIPSNCLTLDPDPEEGIAISTAFDHVQRGIEIELAFVFCEVLLLRLLLSCIVLHSHQIPTRGSICSLRP